MCCSFSVPEQAPFTAVMKYAAEEVQLHQTWCLYLRLHDCVDIVESVLQFKVPAQTSAILTNGKFQVFRVLSESGVPTHALQANVDWMQRTLTACRWGRHQPLTDSWKCFSEAWV